MTLSGWTIITNCATVYLSSNTCTPVAATHTFGRSMPHLLDLLVRHMRAQPKNLTGEHTLYGCASRFLSQASLHHAADILSNPSATNLLLAGLRHLNPRFRSEAFDGLVRLYPHHTPPAPPASLGVDNLLRVCPRLLNLAACTDPLLKDHLKV